MAFKYGQSKIDALIAAVEKMRDSQEIEQLSTYVGRITADRLTDEERKQYVPEHLDNETIGYEIAGTLPVERLRELFEADDWGPAWESMDSEQTEYYEQDEGRIEAFNQVLALLHGDPPTTDPDYGEGVTDTPEDERFRRKIERQDAEDENSEKAESEFDPLMALSLARTALTDPAGLPDTEPVLVHAGAELRIAYAIEKIDAVMGALDFEAGYNDAGVVLSHLGRLIAKVADVIEADRENAPEGEGLAGGAEALEPLRAALDHVDAAIEALS